MEAAISLEIIFTSKFVQQTCREVALSDIGFIRSHKRVYV